MRKQDPFVPFLMETKDAIIGHVVECAGNIAAFSASRPMSMERSVSVYISPSVLVFNKLSHIVKNMLKRKPKMGASSSSSGQRGKGEGRD